MIYNYAKYKEIDITKQADLSVYVDSKKLSDKGKKAFSWAVKNKIIEGFDETHLSPNTGANRAQMATIFMRLIETFDI